MPSSRTIYLIRHGSIDYQYDDQGQKLVPHQIHPLSPQGIQELTALSQQLVQSGVNPSQIWTSPTVRALQSAELIGRASNCEVIITDDRLRCIAEPPSSMEGLPKQTWETRSNIRNQQPPITKIDSLQQVWDIILNQEPGTDKIIVTHGYTLRALLFHITNPGIAGLLPTLEESKILFPIERGECYRITINDQIAWTTEKVVAAKAMR